MTVSVGGGGLAGAAAALAAARHRDVRVVLVSEPGTSLRADSGLVDVLGYTPDGKGPLADPLAAVPDLPADHPYRTVGAEAVRAGLDLFDDVTGDRYAGGERNALVATALGNLKPTARYPRSVAPGVASRERPTLLLGFERLPAVDAPLAAARLDDTLPYRVCGETAELPGRADTLESTDLAAALEDDDTATGSLAGTDAADHGEPFRDVLARRLLDRSIGDGRVGLPAALGYGAVEEVREGLAAAAGTEVFEVPTGPSSVPGRRLERLLREALLDAGVEVRETRVTGAETADGRVTALDLAEGERIATEAAVLATGGVAGGFESDRRGVREPVFGCRIPQPGREGLAAEGALEDQPFAALGVETDDRLRPLDGRGSPEHDNLRAAGRVLGGYDPAAELSGGGVSLATGRVAGRLAAEDAA